jgi:hypothetical protein
MIVECERGIYHVYKQPWLFSSCGGGACWYCIYSLLGKLVIFCRASNLQAVGEGSPGREEDSHIDPVEEGSSCSNISFPFLFFFSGLGTYPWLGSYGADIMTDVVFWL